jgi:hypothetical protein
MCNQYWTVIIRYSMPLDPTLVAETRTWLIKAAQDIRAAGLTEYAWKFRYLGEPDEPSREEAEAALAIAREVYEAVRARLPGEVLP